MVLSSGADEMSTPVIEQMERIQTARHSPNLSPGERWELVREIDEPSLRYHAAVYVPELKPSQRWELVRTLIKGYHRSYAAARIPGLTPQQRFELVRDLDEDCDKCYAAINVPGLSPEQRWSLVKDLQEDSSRYCAALYTPGLTPEQRWELVKNISSDYYRFCAATRVSELSTEQRWQLAKVLGNDYRQRASVEVPDLTEERRRFLEGEMEPEEPETTQGAEETPVELEGLLREILALREILRIVSSPELVEKSRKALREAELRFARALLSSNTNAYRSPTGIAVEVNLSFSEQETR